MSEYVFNDIYGNQLVRDKYESNRQYGYFNTILKLHNKYYQDDSIHKYIFSPRKTHLKLKNKQRQLDPIPINTRVQKQQQKQRQKRQTAFSYYNVQKLNNMTFRISKKNKTTISHGTQLGKFKQKMNSQRYSSQDNNNINRNIIRDVKNLQLALSFDKSKNKSHQKSKNKSVLRSKNDISQFGFSSNELNCQSINRQLKFLSHQHHRNY